MTTSTAFVLFLCFTKHLLTCTTAYQPEMRAWTCHGRSNKELVDHLCTARIIKSPEVKAAMNMVDRGNYVPRNSYIDAPQSIGSGQTISAPHMHAHALEEMIPYLRKSTSDKLTLLDVGCGSGYLTAAMGRWVDPKHPIIKPGKVYGIDIFPDLIDMSYTNINRKDGDLLLDDTVSVQLADGWKGLPDKAPFDAIHVGAAAADFPESLMMQLKVGGVMVIPVGPDGGVQNLYRVEKLKDSTTFSAKNFRVTELLGVRYVPLRQTNM